MAEGNACLQKNNEQKRIMGSAYKSCGRRIARVMFCVYEGRMVLLHGFIKKSNKTHEADLQLATKRMEGLQ